MLATALATPCTAPFLAVALGFALAPGQPAWLILLFFLSIGLGLALPYVVLSFFPQLGRFLPKPGAWMERFKIAMGFPMLATAVWLLSLLERHFGKAGVLWIGMFLVSLAFAAWSWGQFVQSQSRRRGLAIALSLTIIVAGYLVTLEGQLDWRSSRQRSSSVATENAAGHIDWQPWSAAAVAKARAEGRPVFVDFTADWCVTCQANKKTSIEIPSVRAKLKEINAVALLGDYTLEDEAITEELMKWGRAGVPLVLVYPTDPTKGPLVLPEFLTPGIVLDFLSQAAPKAKARTANPLNPPPAEKTVDSTGA